MKEKYFRIIGGFLLILVAIFKIFNIKFYTNLIIPLGVIIVFIPPIIKKESNGDNENQRQIKKLLVSILIVFLIALIFSYLIFNK